MASVMEIVSPLGADLLFYRLQGQEQLGRLFAYEVELLSLKKDIDGDKILAANVTVKLELPGGAPRCFNGFVTRFVQAGTHGRYYLYRATVRPWLWFLTRAANCRIFPPGKSVPEIVEMVFAKHAVADFDKTGLGSYGPREYCVQYRETDFNLVSRLLEEEGIYYYFRHQEGRHTLVLADAASSHKAFPGYEQIPYIGQDRTPRLEQEYIHDWTLAREVQTGRYALRDYDFERPGVDLLVQARSTAKRGHALADYEIYDYPGVYTSADVGDHYAHTRIDELQHQFETASASSNARGVCVGSLFKAAGLPRPEQNRDYLVVAAHYRLEYGEYEAAASRGADVFCQFTALASQEQFRPPRLTPKPFVQGPQTALVVGPPGEEIHTDKYGRVIVQFHWDREGKKDANSSCWIRVSQPWAGKNWGMVAIPRIGQEVVVDFLEGDPDRPLIVGRVYNAEQMPPYELPLHKTQTGIKSRSSLGGSGANCNEIRFEDKKGEEQVLIHAEKDQDIEVEHDETHKVGHDRTKTVGNDETSHIKHNRSETVDNDESIAIGGNRSETVAKNESIGIEGNRSESVTKNESISIGGSRNEDVAENESVTVGKDRVVEIGGNESLTVAGNREQSVAKNDSLTVQEVRKTSIGKDDLVQVGKKFALEAGDEISLVSGSASLTLKKDGTIQLKGADITIAGSGKIGVKADGDLVLKGSKIAQN